MPGVQVRMEVRAKRLCVLLLQLIFLTTSGLAADGSSSASVDNQRMKLLEERLQQVEREAAALRQELDALKASQLPPGTAASPTPSAEADEPLDLTAVETEPPSPAPRSEVAPSESQVSAADVQVVQNRSATSASKVFNPDISVIGNIVGSAGDSNSLDSRPTMELHEAEVGLEAFVDPYAKAKFFLTFGPEEVGVEEGYINFINLPLDLTAKAGKMKTSFGKLNMMHPHVWPWIDPPLVVRSMFGEEGLNDSGISVSRIFRNPWNLYIEGTGEVYRGSVDHIFEPNSANDLLYLGHLKLYRDLSESSNLELGTSFARGTAPEGGRNQFGGLDVTYRWKPLQRSIYESFISRSELIWNDRPEGAGGQAFGFYTSGDYQFARRWYAGLRIGQSERPLDPSLTDREAALTLTFWPSEFSQLRTELRRTRDATGDDATDLLFQAIFSIGAHGAHAF